MNLKIYFFGLVISIISSWLAEHLAFSFHNDKTLNFLLPMFSSLQEVGSIIGKVREFHFNTNYYLVSLK